MSSASRSTTEVAVGIVWAISRLRARLRAETAPTDQVASWSQIMTLVRIVTDGPMTGAALAQAEHVRPQSMHETIAALREQGLVQASPHPEDGRKLLVSATDEGRELIQQIPALRAAWLERAIEACVEPAELEALEVAARVMDRLADCKLD